MQLGVDLSTSQVENNFIGTGLTPAPDAEPAFADNCCVRPVCSAIFVVVDFPFPAEIVKPYSPSQNDTLLFSRTVCILFFLSTVRFATPHWPRPSAIASRYFVFRALLVFAKFCLLFIILVALAVSILYFDSSYKLSNFVSNEKLSKGVSFTRQTVYKFRWLR